MTLANMGDDIPASLSELFVQRFTPKLTTRPGKYPKQIVVKMRRIELLK